RNADLRSANLRIANLSSASLRNADFSNAYLRNAYLSNADLFGTNLSNADLFGTNLRNTDLIRSIFLATDLKTVRNLTVQQLTGEAPPLICNSPLPEGIEFEGGKDRDCDKLPAVLLERYPSRFETLEEAETYLEEQRQKEWE
ncbi:pentapeptide repeat-containing protein, partial [Oscillatoria sp. CS-180]|uniref:pentapeptide repeat-containing protein n=1 Tax=Oscillatoria sp. CS-180 TaxID=3021720 RepID=UPI00232FA161